MALARAQLSAAAADLTAAFGSYLPSITFSAGYSRQLNVEGGRTINVGGQIIRLPAVDPNSYSMSLIGTYTLFDGFVREGVFQQRRAAVDAAEAGLEFTRQQLVAQVVQHYIEALKAERIVAVRQRFYELAQQELERARAQVELGRMAPTLLPTQGERACQPRGRTATGTAGARPCPSALGFAHRGRAWSGAAPCRPGDCRFHPRSRARGAPAAAEQS
jgi:hypothetical protein